MQWYYSTDDRQQGPVSEADLEAMARAGKVNPETLVWREGMAEWVPYSSVTTSPGGAGGTIPAAGQARCAECGQVFSMNDMLTFDNSHVCAGCKPRFFQKMREGLAVGGTGLWRYKKQLVSSLNPALPPRCIKCNAPTDTLQKSRNLYWHHPAAYLGLFGGIIPYVIVAMILRKRSTLSLSICPADRAKRRNAILAGWLLVLGGLAALIGGGANEMGWVAGLGGIMFLGGIIYGIVKGRLVYATKIDKERLWLGGCGKEFLAEFPEWTGAR